MDCSVLSGVFNSWQAVKVHWRVFYLLLAVGATGLPCVYLLLAVGEAGLPCVSLLLAISKYPWQSVLPGVLYSWQSVKHLAICQRTLPWVFSGLPCVSLPQAVSQTTLAVFYY